MIEILIEAIIFILIVELVIVPIIGWRSLKKKPKMYYSREVGKMVDEGYTSGGAMVNINRCPLCGDGGTADKLCDNCKKGMIKNLKDVILLKTSIPQEMAEKIATKTGKLVIRLDNLGDFSTLSKENIIKILEKLKGGTTNSSAR